MKIQIISERGPEIARLGRGEQVIPFFLNRDKSEDSTGDDEGDEN